MKPILTKKMKKNGNKLVGRCPYHAEITASCVYDPSTDRFRCLCCGKEGPGAELAKAYLVKKTEIVGKKFDEYLNTEIPVIIAERLNDGSGTARFYCDACLHEHTHGDEDGHRVAHCGMTESKYWESGYILKIV